MALSTGQVNDAYQTALKRAPTSAELATYTGDQSMDGSGGQQTLITKLGGGGSSSSSSSVSGIDYGAAYQQASSQIPGVDTSGLQQTATDLTTAAKAKSDAITASIPTVQNIYTD